MLTFRRQILLKLFKLLDLLNLSVAFLLGALAVSYKIPNVPFESLLSMRIKIGNFIIFFLLLLLWHKIYDYFGLYNSRRLSHKLQEVFDLAKATTLATLLIALSTAIFRIKIITPLFLLVFWLSVTGISISTRLTGRFIFDKIRTKGRNLRYMLILGTNQRAIKFAEQIEARPHLGYKIIGFMDDEWVGVNEIQKKGFQLKGGINDFPAFIRSNVVDEVAIGLPVKSQYEQISTIVRFCEKQGIITRFLSKNLFNQELARSKAGIFEGNNFITFYTGKLASWPILVKRIMDFSVSLIMIICALPVLLIISLGIKLTSPGPIFFIQERVGLNKRRFRLYKFRTMIPNAEKMMTELEHLNEVDGPAFKLKKDPRITPFGKFLRKMSLDESPQLINVLKGDMSLVGPRPLPLRDYNGFNHDWQRRRFSVRPGLTCIWQINGRGNTTFEKWMKQDMEYIDTWSLWLDLKILIRTIPAVLKSEGAS